MVFIVKLNGKVVGGLTIYMMHQYYSVNPLAYIPNLFGNGKQVDAEA
jgi:hypothetical protein